VDEQDWLARRFDAHRTRLRTVAYRMLGSISEADAARKKASSDLGRKLWCWVRAASVPARPPSTGDL